jgi:putative SOS response-associated peptidase YedK
MCGRFTLRSSPQAVAEAFALPDVPELFPRFNIAPGEPVAVVRQPAVSKSRELAFLRWSLIPAWADDPSIGERLANARSETAATKPSFRRAFRSRRCLVVADGFYEWQKVNGRKQPYFVGLQSDRPFGLAGLWERWEKGSELVESCTILTTEANELMHPIHDRMPVILGPKDFDRWLDPDQKDPAKVQGLLRPYPAEAMLAYPVSRLVNDPKHEDPRCLEPQAAAEPEAEKPPKRKPRK